MNILDKIIATKLLEVEARKQVCSRKQLEQSLNFERRCLSLAARLKDPAGSGVIAEFKRKSPSKGVFSAMAKTSEICPAYQAAGAAGLSILTDTDFFGGCLADIEEARPLVSIPILRKDFTVDEYQILEAKAAGADAILLIAAALSVSASKALSSFARSLGLEVLLEVHNKEELLDYCHQDITLLGVNNRDLKTFQTNIELSKNLATLIPESFVKVTESGINNPSEVIELKSFGYSGFLIGESFMRNHNPGQSCASFIGALR